MIIQTGNEPMTTQLIIPIDAIYSTIFILFTRETRDDFT